MLHVIDTMVAGERKKDTQAKAGGVVAIKKDNAAKNVKTKTCSTALLQ